MVSLPAQAGNELHNVYSYGENESKACSKAWSQWNRDVEIYCKGACFRSWGKDKSVYKGAGQSKCVVKSHYRCLKTYDDC